MESLAELCANFITLCQSHCDPDEHDIISPPRHIAETPPGVPKSDVVPPSPADADR
jgi:hypothetical protein